MSAPTRWEEIQGTLNKSCFFSGQRYKYRPHRNEAAIETARRYESDCRSFWTDGSALAGGVGAAAVVGFVEGSVDEGGQENRMVRQKRGVVKRGERGVKGVKTYGQRYRSIRQYGSERGFRAELWSLDGDVTAFDAELAALVRGLKICVLDAVPEACFNIFSDSQAAIGRLEPDEPAPGQDMAIQGIRLADEIVRRGAAVTIRWVPGHVRVPGNEVADMWATEAAAREKKTREGRNRDGRAVGGSTSLTYHKTMLRKRAASEWRQEIITRGQGGSRRAHRIPADGRIPRIPAGLRGALRELTSRFFQLASGHAMIAPLLKEKFGWMDPDRCFWCGRGRETREHPFKECTTWKKEVGKLWKEVGEASNVGKITGERGVWGAQRFCLGMGRGVSIPGNTLIRNFLSDERFVEAGLEFLRFTSVRKCKQGVLLRDTGVCVCEIKYY